ncbi:hypothetical protein [Nitratireductor sp. ZSWI3]|uniref:hypothetical protein n=1 Tax=Nitratireductor sp. ZSWI3 TaxID=2966359 RepID=UPI0021500B35|nr:hypothetical protein [Nitratireductor sp. ZSWI3]MCR4267077.1 hypothetical protein [Nitratireductor sp. ZSWI3]
MEHIAALLLIVGCSGNLGECRELPAPTPVYETFEECEAEKPVSLRELSSEAPHVVATCVYVDPALEYDDATIEWDVTPDGKLVASIEPVTDDLTVAMQVERDRHTHGE